MLQSFGGVMSPKRLSALLVFFAVSIATALAQRNEVSGTIGRVFVSSQMIQGATFFNPNIHFGSGLTVGGNYSRLLKTYGIFGISGEVPFAYSFDMDLNTGRNLIPEGYKSFFVTPAARLNIFN